MTKLEKIIRATILFLFAIVFSLTITSASVYNFVHQRHIPMIIFAVIIFIISAFIELIYKEYDEPCECVSTECVFDEHKSNSNKKGKTLNACKKYFSLLIFLIPLVLYFFASDGIKLSSVAQNLDMKNQIQRQGQNKKQSKPNPFTGIPKRSMELSDGKIIITNENFSAWLTEIYTKSYSYYDEEIELSGELWHGEKLPENEFAIGRFMMLCCAADMQPVGLLCKAKEKVKLEDGDWIKLRGILKERSFEDEPSEPYIEVISIEKTKKPKKSYVDAY